MTTGAHVHMLCDGKRVPYETCAPVLASVFHNVENRCQKRVPYKHVCVTVAARVRVRVWNAGVECGCGMRVQYAGAH